jgi:hypothetical protein
VLVLAESGMRSVVLISASSGRIAPVDHTTLPPG